MTGMHRATGKAIEGDDHIAQSVADILTTPLGSRVMRRDYGSRLPDLIDAPMNAATRQRIAAASAGAIARWEPRLRLSRVRFGAGRADGELSLLIEGERVDAPRPVPLSFSIAI